ncbi:MAG TPA: toll/interleukin-1 receptor domain-containing protein [Cytophagaceae bacterium]|jgi:hypothetical protein|nr:toll/interleukin-1 receptor domain-containing protein [Cytophagaceae bacterium]
MDGVNRALEVDYLIEKSIRFFSQISDDDIPCIFISYQRRDEDYASEVAEYIKSKQLDVYFDLEDNDLKLQNQIVNPKEVTNAIRNGLNKSQYMIVIISPNTIRSPWVPFEVGYAFDEKGDNMKLLRHKEINKNTIPDYLKVKEMLQGSSSLDEFLKTIRKNHLIYENLMKKGEEVKTFSEYTNNPLNKYLDNE